MATEFKLPELGENIESGDVVKVLVSPGHFISKDQPVLELETDKAVIEVPAPVSGVAKAVHVKEGEKIKVGQLILTIEEGAEPKAKPVEAGPGAIEGKKEVVTKEVREEVVPEAKPREVIEAPAAAPSAPPTAPRLAAPATPSVRRLARELGVDINQVTGSGPRGRISVEDVKAFARRLLTGRAVPPSGIQPAVQPLPDFTRWGEVERKPMSSIRRKTAENMSYAWTTIPHVTHFDKADITELEQRRQRFEEKAKAVRGKLTVTAILLKVAASALKVFPQFNASVDMSRGEIVYKKYYHIGVAVDTDRGLLVPVIRDVDRKNILELSVELTQIAEKARNRKLTLEEMQGGTFTITNLGGIGGTYFAPIINAPEVAILGIARATIEPVYVNGQFEPRRMLPLSLSYDHRVIDGADAARFLRWVVESLQEPFLLALEG